MANICVLTLVSFASGGLSRATVLALALLALANPGQVRGQFSTMPTPVPTAAAAQANSSKPPLAIAPQDGVLLLRNGRTLRGKFTRDGDRYYLALPGGEIRIRATDVEFACDSLEGCYQYRRQRVDAGSVEGHLNLAQWCIENELLGPAAEQMFVALSIDPAHPKLALLQRRLDAARLEPKGEAHLNETPSDYISADDLDKFCKSLPQGTVETFTNRIHPLLQNHCGNAGCHGSQTPSQFRMIRAPANKAASSRLTQRNLHAVLMMVNREDPARSALLTAPIKPHGDQKQAIFQTHDIAQYNELVQWVVWACGSQPKSRPDTLGDKPVALRQSEPGQLPSIASQMVQPLSASEGAEAGVPGAEANPTASSLPKLERAADPAQLAPPQVRAASGIRPSDPFHADLFNRRFFPEGNPRLKKAEEEAAMPE